MATIISPRRDKGFCSVLFTGERFGGKTLGGGRTANVLAAGRPFIGIDLETHDSKNPASSLYADELPLYHGVIHLPEPTPDAFLDAVKEAYKFGGPVLFVDGLANLSEWEYKTADALARKMSTYDLHAAYGKVRPITNEAMDLLLKYPGFIVATCVMKWKTHREIVKKGNQSKTEITTYLGVDFNGDPPLEKRFMLTVQVKEVPRDESGKVVDHQLTTYRTKIPDFKNLNLVNIQGGLGVKIYEWARMEQYPDLKTKVKPQPVEQVEPDVAPDEQPQPTDKKTGLPYDPDSLWNYRDWSVEFYTSGDFIKALDEAIADKAVTSKMTDEQAALALLNWFYGTDDQ